MNIAKFVLGNIRVKRSFGVETMHRTVSFLTTEVLILMSFDYQVNDISNYFLDCLLLTYSKLNDFFSNFDYVHGYV